MMKNIYKKILLWSIFFIIIIVVSGKKTQEIKNFFLGKTLNTEENYKAHIMTVRDLENLARDNKNSSLCYKIAEKYINGDGVTKDLALASMWFDLGYYFDNYESEEEKKMVNRKRGDFFVELDFVVVSKAKELLSQYLIENKMLELHSKIFDDE